MGHTLQTPAEQVSQHRNGLKSKSQQEASSLKRGKRGNVTLLTFDGQHSLP